MKKTINIFIAIFIIILLTTGCGENKNKESKENTTYTFSYNNKNLVLGEEFKKEEIGEPLDYSEVASCAFEGLDKTYTYEHFELTTFPDGEKDKIYSIYFLDNEITTNEGIKIGDTKEDLISKYGDNYQQEDNLYAYKIDKTSLKFIIEDNSIISIEYSYDA